MTSQVEVYDREGIGHTHFVWLSIEPLHSERQRTIATPTNESQRTMGSNTRKREQEWLRQNGLRYSGEWVAIEEDKLIAHGDDALAVLQQARLEGVQHPLLVQIPSEPPLPFGGW
jgi:hypothetical protein